MKKEALINPELLQMDFLVEQHNCFNPKISSMSKELFAHTHYYQLIVNRPTPHVDLTQRQTPSSTSLNPIDGWVADSDACMGATPWAFFEAINKEK